MSRQLLVIDVQEGFMSAETEAAAHEIKNLLEAEIFDPVVFTRFRNAEDSPHRNILGWHKMDSDAECEIWAGVRGFARDVIGKATYSAVTPELRQRIAREGSDTIFLTGFDTECCVLKTAADLFEEGIRPVVLSDYCASNGGEAGHRAGLTALSRLIGRKNILSGLKNISELKRKIAEFLSS